MEYQFETLTRLFFKHEFFSDSKFEDIEVTPERKSIQTLNNRALLFKSFNGGCQLLFNTTLAGRSRRRSDLLKDPFYLNFQLRLNDPFFYNYTANVSHDITQSLFYFRNSSGEQEASIAAGTLHKGDFVTTADLHPVNGFPGQSFSPSFGVLELQVSEKLEEVYTIAFQARDTFWRYLLIKDHFRELHQPAILNAKNQQVFNGPEELALPDGRAAWLFSSKNKIQLQESVSAPFQLVEDYDAATGKFKVVKKGLPLPDVTTLSKIRAAPHDSTKQEFSEIIIY